jgi:uncharacterized protein YjbI with pentapeptide repeats
MGLQRHRLWHKTKKLLVVCLVIAICTNVVGLIIAEYQLHWTWTGFDKTLWDWMQLLIIPVSLALGAFLLNRSDQRREQEIAIDDQRETLLQSYLDRMSELLLEKGLNVLQTDNEVIKVARARTLTTLRRLDADRKKSVINFLMDTGLLFIIDLSEANLSGIAYYNYHVHSLKNLNLARADLSYASLEGLELENVNFEEANFSWARLIRVKGPHNRLQRIVLRYSRMSEVDLNGSNLAGGDLRGAVLNHVILSNTDLSHADLRGATLSNTDLSHADLRGANLSNTNLRSANLQGALLGDANLKGAKFRKQDAHSQRPCIADAVGVPGGREIKTS